MKTVGIDLSLTSTGIAVVMDHTIHLTRHKTASTGKELEHRHRRIGAIVQTVREWTKHADLVVIEGPSYGSTHGHQHDRSGLWWLLVHRLLAQETPVAVAPPATRARYATGRGNADKDAVLVAVVRRYIQANVTGNDQADALVLAAMGARKLGHPIDSVPKLCLAAMDGVAWPTETGLL